MYYYVQKGIFIVVDLKKILIIVFIILYALGMVFGCLEQISTENQNDMYTYLEDSISAYDVPVSESVKSILLDNAKLFAVLVAGGLFMIGPILLVVLVFLKGYSTGFAVISILRLFGIRGMLLCAANIMSAAVIVPAVCWFSAMCCVNILTNRYDRKTFLKRFFVLIAFMLPIMLLDGFVRGALSSLLMKIGTKW